MAEDKSELDEELNQAEPAGAEADIDVDKPETVDESTDQTEESSPEVQPPVIPPPLTHEVQEHDGRRWPIIAGYLIAALAVAVIIVFGARAIYHSAHHSQPAPVSPGSGVPKIPRASSKSSKKTSSSSSSKTSTPNTAAVPNTGPGNTVGLFVGISLAAAGLHYIISLRRAKS